MAAAENQDVLFCVIILFLQDIQKAKDVLVFPANRKSLIAQFENDVKIAWRQLQPERDDGDDDDEGDDDAYLRHDDSRTGDTNDDENIKDDDNDNVDDDVSDADSEDLNWWET